MIHLAPLAHIDAHANEALLDHAFGKHRHARTAYKVRGEGPMIDLLSFAAIAHDKLVGSIQCWPVVLTTLAQERLPLIMVGPVCVEKGFWGKGVGGSMMARMLDAAAQTNQTGAMMLIGDPEYYGRFGFEATRTAQWRLPGPVERHRLLARGPAVPDLAGMLGAA